MIEAVTQPITPDLKELLAAKGVFADRLRQAVKEYHASTGAFLTDISVSMMTHTHYQVVNHSDLSDLRLRVTLQIDGRPVDLEV